jgi:ABC-type transport system involved in cytochrome c biogenesis permease subunit
MTPSELAELSRFLYSPVTIGLYLAASFASLHALTTNVGRREGRGRGSFSRRLGLTLAVLGVAAHVAHEVVRGLAQSRLPLGNMFEVTSMMALVGVVVGLVYLRRVRRQPDLEGFVLLGGALLLGLALLMYAEPGPLMPILDTWWRTFHVSLLVGAMGVMSAGFVFTSLYLLRDTGERALVAERARVAAPAAVGGSTAGAAHRDALVEGEGETLGVVDRVGEIADPAPIDVEAADAHRRALRRGIPVLRLAVGTFLGTSVVSWVWVASLDPRSAGVARMLTVNLVMVGAALVARWFAPYLPDTATLDGLAHRTIAFGFVMWTVGTIAGAMWAEQSWGRFWGWDPKETGAFLTWVAYAGYLHGRATRGVKGRRAAWIGIGAYVVLMATYLVANYVIVGLHSYAGL